MNLKEAFRYQNFLGSIMSSAETSICLPGHCTTKTKTHLRSKVNTDAEDTVEVEEKDASYFENDSVVKLMEWLVDERSKLTTAIDKAKASLSFDIDAAIESNKFRQQAGRAIKQMMSRKGGKIITRGSDYKFNNEGNQMPYYYDVEIVETEAYDREKAKATMKFLVSEADRISAEVDAAMVNTEVEYEVVYDVNESFEDVMTEFLKKIA